jgi:hypothetical protein
VFAESCVFDKQSLLPIYCGLQELSPPKAPLIANLRGHFAEFLNHRSPERLRLLVSPTCVSFSTVNLLQSLEDFLEHPSNDFLVKPVGRVPCFMRVDFPIPPAQYTPRTFLFVPLTFRVLSLHRSTNWGRNINLQSIVYAFRPRLRYRLTLGGITFPRKP